MRTSLLIASAVATALVSAAPGGQRDAYAWSPVLAGYYEKVAQHIQQAKSSGQGPPSCDLSRAILPEAPSPLPSPDGLVLAHVAVGRGIQNYTCESDSPDVKPVAIGALAHLYNASCMAAAYPDLLELLPDLALQYPLEHPGVPDPDNSFAKSNHLLSQYANIQSDNNAQSGLHFFSNKTPVFELNFSPYGASQNLGIVQTKGNANSTAPKGSCPGVNWEGDGTILWLMLDAIDSSSTTEILADGVASDEQAVKLLANSSSDKWKRVYRVNTAGGAPPKSCQGRNPKEVISVQYAANYWYYKGD